MTTIIPETGRLNPKLTARRTQIGAANVTGISEMEVITALSPTLGSTSKRTTRMPTAPVVIPPTPLEDTQIYSETPQSRPDTAEDYKNSNYPDTSSRPSTGKSGTTHSSSTGTDDRPNSMGSTRSSKAKVNLPPGAKSLLLGNPIKRDSDSEEDDNDVMGMIQDETPLQKAIRLKKRREKTAYTSLNTPMLIAILRKSYREEPSARSGLTFILKHCQNGEGCVLAMKHLALEIIFKVQAYDEYRYNAPIQLLVISIFRKLVECNYTRDAIIYKTDVLRVAFSITHRFMQSLEHVEVGVNCLLQCCRSEICRVDMMDLKCIPYCILFCKKHWKSPTLVRSILKIFNWISTIPERMDEICRGGAIETTVECMKRHCTNPVVLASAVGFLTRAAAMLEWCMELILEQKLIPLIIRSLRALHNEEELQMEGLKILQTLSTTPEGYKQISETRGGWQSICQGTSLGNALFHELEGEFHNPGWAIGDTPNLSIVERRKQAAIDQWSKKYIGLVAKYAWTSRSLQEFMGLSMNAKTLASTIEFNEAHFELLKTLDLLPKNPGEDRGVWFNRLAAYEKENELQIEDMVRVILDMKKKDEKRKAEEELKLKGEADEAAPNLGGEKVKPVYVNGQRITMKAMAENDAAADELANL